MWSAIPSCWVQLDTVSKKEWQKPPKKNLEQKATKFTVPVSIPISVSLPTTVAVTDNFSVLENSVQQLKVGGAEVEGRDASPIVVAEGS
jgi:hypothetical protein